jgi:chromosome partitioning protein
MIFKRRDRDAADQESNAAPETPESSVIEPESGATPPPAEESPGSADDHDSPAMTRPDRDRSDRFSWGAGDIIINPRPASAAPAVADDDEDDEEEEQPLLESETDAEDAEDPEEGSDEPPHAPSGDQQRKQFPLPRVMAVANQKGGVGKTTTTVNLSAALADLGYRVLVLDLDPQGNATTGLGIDARNFELSMYDVLMRDADLADVIEPTSVGNLFVGPATIDLAGVEIELVSAFSRELKLKRAISSVIDDFDYILIDCPPSLGLITINGLAAATEVLVPIQCEYYALEGLGQLLRNVKLVSGSLNPVLEVSTIVLTMYDSRTRLAADVAMEVRNHFPNEVCDSVIPRTVRLSEAPSFGQPITVFDPTSRGAKAYRALAREVSNGASKRTR